jgi:hypothetical protein
MKEDLAAQLRRLGVTRGAAALKDGGKSKKELGVENLISGRLCEGASGFCFVVESEYSLEHTHGDRTLGSLLDQKPGILRHLVPGFHDTNHSFENLVFMDTETTGLSAGAGTIAFLVGIGYFRNSQFVVQQLFLRTPGDEIAMLEQLEKVLQQRTTLVTFNGRCFDVPLMESRFILNRRVPPFRGCSHIDLLPPSRRLWRNVLDSCRLVALETEVLGVKRDQNDIPSGEIPLIYRDYLQTGNGIEMKRIFYHNQVDVMSMVSLADRVCRSLEQPHSVVQHGQEWMSLARWYEEFGLLDKAEESYRQASFILPPKEYESALQGLANLLKRTGRRDEATEVWEKLAAVEIGDVRGHVELAKHFEWYARDLVQASEWTRRALDLIDRRDGPLRGEERIELCHRLTRIERKSHGRSNHAQG